MQEDSNGGIVSLDLPEEPPTEIQAEQNTSGSYILYHSRVEVAFEQNVFYGIERCVLKVSAVDQAGSLGLPQQPG